MPDPTAELPPLTPKQQRLLTQYRQSADNYWQIYDSYKAALRLFRKTGAACCAAGFNPTSYLDPDA